MSAGDNAFKELSEKASILAFDTLADYSSKELTAAEVSLLNLGIACGMRVVMEEIHGKASAVASDHFAE